MLLLICCQAVLPFRSLICTVSVTCPSFLILNMTGDIILLDCVWAWVYGNLAPTLPQILRSLSTVNTPFSIFAPLFLASTLVSASCNIVLAFLWLLSVATLLC